MRNRYTHLRQYIEEYFKNNGILIEIETRRPQDFQSIKEGANKKPLLVGEIKKERELYYDLPSRYWSHWNNPNTGATGSRGGKPKGYVLREAESLDRAVAGLSHRALGFVATVMGQLKFYARYASLSEGWLVIENASRWRAPLSEALDALQRSNHVHQDPLDIDSHGIGYVCIHYL